MSHSCSNVGGVCLTCRFWHRINDNIEKEPTQNLGQNKPPCYNGQCRRYPPKIGSQEDDNLWPVTTLIDWCGEYKSLV